jgi:hypothetical protein
MVFRNSFAERHRTRATYPRSTQVFATARRWQSMTTGFDVSSA